MDMNCKNVISAIIVSIIATGCTSGSYLRESNKPSSVAEAFVVTDIISPTRVEGRSGVSSYFIDLAYLVPRNRDCKGVEDVCEILSHALKGKEVWVQKEYSRYGVNMHTIWLPDSMSPAIQSENIKLLMNGYGESVNVDTRDIPNGKGKLVSTANEVGRERIRLKKIKDKLPQWRLDNIADADSIEMMNMEAPIWQEK